MVVIVTGAAGRIGRHVVAELGGRHELRLLDRVGISGHRSIRADLSRGRPTGRKGLPWRTLDLPRWERSFSGADCVVHLAANPAPTASWDAVLRQNVRATWNVFDAAARRGVKRVVVASSFAGVLGFRSAQELGVAKVLATAPPRPCTAYGLSKAIAELAGRMFVDRGDVRTVIVARIGMFREQMPDDQVARRWWISPADIRTGFRRCLEAEAGGFHIVNLVSRFGTEVIDLSYTRDLLEWVPEDS